MAYSAHKRDEVFEQVSSSHISTFESLVIDRHDVDVKVVCRRRSAMYRSIVTAYSQ